MPYRSEQIAGEIGSGQRFYFLARTKFCARKILFSTNTTFTTNGSSVAYEVLQKVR
jgi:hypothetical protein